LANPSAIWFPDYEVYNGYQWPNRIIFEDSDKHPLFEIKLMGNAAIVVRDTGKLIASIDGGEI
jgi:hypothetical protein